jgi:glycosyltransferase involved in cell wall biosynthesis
VREPPRILLLVTLAETGGAQTYVAELVPALVADYDVTVAAHGDGPLEEAVRRAGARYHPLRHVRRSISPWRDVLGLLELLVLMRRLHPQVAHANSSKAGILGRFAAWLARVPIRIFTVHGWAFAAAPGLERLLYLWAERLAGHLTSTTICVSEADRDAGIAAHTCAARTSMIIRNGIDAKSRPRARPDDDPPVIVSVGRLQAPKDPLTLVRAIGQLRDDRVRAIVVGGGPDRPAVERELARLGLTTVDLVGQRADVADLLAEAQVFVLATRSEGLPFSVLEAMAAGLPVVASRVGGVPELVVEGETGFLVPPADPSALAGALDGLLADPDLRERLGAAGRARVEGRFRLDVSLRAHLDLYRRELARRGLQALRP